MLAGKKMWPQGETLKAGSKQQDGGFPSSPNILKVPGVFSPIRVEGYRSVFSCQGWRLHNNEGPLYLLGLESAMESWKNSRQRICKK